MTCAWTCDKNNFIEKLKEKSRDQNRGPQFARGRAVNMYMDMSQKLLENAGRHHRTKLAAQTLCESAQSNGHGHVTRAIISRGNLQEKCRGAESVH